MKRLDYDELSVELQELFDEYFELFGGRPDSYEELDGPCKEAYDPKLLRKAIEKNIELPEVVLGKNYWKRMRY